MSIELEHVFDYHAELKSPIAAGEGPYGLRTFYEVTGGRIEGPRVSGELLAGGGDWALVGRDGWARLDVRGQFRTDDGAIVYVAYPGIVQLTPAMLAAQAAGEDTNFDDQYFRTTPTFETGDERYRWLTQSVFVGRGRLHRGGGVAYEVFRVA